MQNAMNRRNLLAAASAVALVPIVAAHATGIDSIATPGQADGLAALVAKHADTFAKCREVWAFIDDRLDEDHNPQSAQVKSFELGPHHRIGVAHPILMHFDTCVDRYIDKAIKRCTWHIDNNISAEFHRNNIALFEQDRAKAKQLIVERDAVYEAFKRSSGITAAENESEVLCGILDDTESTIMNWKCMTLEEVTLKSNFLVDNWKHLEDGRIQEVLRSMGGIG